MTIDPILASIDLSEWLEIKGLIESLETRLDDYAYGSDRYHD